MRSHFDADWAFGIQGAMENIVRENFPSQVRQWPLLQSFDAEGYQVGTEHFVIVLRDRLSGIPTTAGSLKPFPYEDHPSLPPSSENMVEWMSYLIDRFSLRNEDVAMVLPIHDSGQHGAPSDYELFTDDKSGCGTIRFRSGLLGTGPPCRCQPLQPQIRRHKGPLLSLAPTTESPSMPQITRLTS